MLHQLNYKLYPLPSERDMYVYTNIYVYIRNLLLITYMYMQHIYIMVKKNWIHVLWNFEIIRSFFWGSWVSIYMDFNCVPFLQKHVYEYLPTNLLLIFNDKLLCKIVYLKAYFPRSYIIWTIYGIWPSEVDPLPQFVEYTPVVAASGAASSSSCTQWTVPSVHWCVRAP